MTAGHDHLFDSLRATYYSPPACTHAAPANDVPGSSTPVPPHTDDDEIIAGIGILRPRPAGFIDAFLTDPKDPARPLGHGWIGSFTGRRYALTELATRAGATLHTYDQVIANNCRVTKRGGRHTGVVTYRYPTGEDDPTTTTVAVTWTIGGTKRHLVEKLIDLVPAPQAGQRRDRAPAPEKPGDTDLTTRAGVIAHIRHNLALVAHWASECMQDHPDDPATVQDMHTVLSALGAVVGAVDILDDPTPTEPDDEDVLDDGWYLASGPDQIVRYRRDEHGAQVPATLFDAVIVEAAQNPHGEYRGGGDPETMAHEWELIRGWPYQLVEVNVRGGYWVSSHPTAELAAAYHNSQEFAEDWGARALFDHTTGQRFAAEPAGESFHVPVEMWRLVGDVDPAAGPLL